MFELPSHLSASQINMILSCGELYWRRYGLKEEFPVTTSLIKGLSFHKMSEKYFKRILHDGYVFNTIELKKIVIEELDEFFKGDIHFTTQENELTRAENKMHLAQLIIPTVPTFAEFVADITPVQTEVRSEISIPGKDKTIVYIMDLEDTDECISDWKVSAKKKSQQDADTDLGLTVYALAYYAKYKKFPKKIRYLNMVTYKTTKNKVYKHALHVIETVRTLDDFNALFNRIYKILSACSHDIFLPAEVGHWKCAERYCHRYMQCKYIGRKRIKTSEGWSYVN